ncbi:MAG: hypothetical protein Q7T42_03895 [Methylotenera sp.]|uniref:hypothetical protein n=1 Tax=Methylotenera sp. TaxID=2051956 RepID=UPI002726C17B|nr:hypothetical protein [Methylotenera sp.]MDO9393102.1 hypothetical protein [Methylotenera sp.]MDP1523940.1 hypothetical protein [Methylotenera sp.]MDP2172758.1 hypothetical protein [Candidatus Cloacimonadaceae bacterium]MDZ4210256.1 hypothetical protein [Methylotenera sp.]
MTPTLVRIILTLIVVGVISTAFAGETLKNDPFARPLLSATLPNNAENTAVNIEEEMPWHPTLSAVMLAGRHSMVTLDGAILKIGEEKDGYRLVQVKDHEAVFKKGKKRIVLKMETGPKADPNSSIEKSLSRQNKEQDNPQ